MTRVLIVEDDPSMSVALRDGFQYEGYDVTLVNDGQSGLDQALENPPDLMVLDVMLPKLTGLDVCREIRTRGIELPIIMLTARGQEIDKVLGLKLGADDYVTKPFGFMELMARAEAVLRRCTPTARQPSTLSFGDVNVDFRRHEAKVGKRLVTLSPREFQLLEYMGSRLGEVVSRDELLESVWGYNHIPYTRTVDMHIAKLRKKIESDPARPEYIVTIHGAGYKLVG